MATPPRNGEAGRLLAPAPLFVRRHGLLLHHFFFSGVEAGEALVVGLRISATIVT
jgi:hypothetical protein